MSQNSRENIDQFANKLSRLKLLEPSEKYRNFELLHPKSISTTMWRCALPVFAIATLMFFAAMTTQLFFYTEIDDRKSTLAAKANRNATYQLGTDYFAIRGTDNLDTNAPEVIQFFWYPCRPCYAFENTFSDWSNHLNSTIDVKRIPAIWSQPMRVQARAYYSAEALGVLNQVHLKLFQAAQEGDQDANDLDAIVAVFSEAGIDRFAFDKTFNSDEISEKVAAAESELKKYSVTSTPTLIIEGKYLVNPNMTGDFRQTLNVADYLLTGRSCDPSATDRIC